MNCFTSRTKVEYLYLPLLDRMYIYIYGEKSNLLGVGLMDWDTALLSKPSCKLVSQCLHGFTYTV